MNTFRLLHASGEREQSNLLSPAPRLPTDAYSVTFSDKPKRSASDAWVTIIIGKNGVGKSRLLSELSDVFGLLDQTLVRSRRVGRGVGNLTYWCNGALCNVTIHDGLVVRATIDGLACATRDLPLPTKVIALTTTPFDKFRVSRSMSMQPVTTQAFPRERYTYLGLRDGSGRASPTAVIFRALEGLFEASKSGAQRRSRISEVFRFLGYQPYVEVKYQISMGSLSRLEQFASGGPVLPGLLDRDQSSKTSALERIIGRDEYALSEIELIAGEVLDRARGRPFFSLRADFQSQSVDQSLFQRVQLLRRANIVTMRAVEVERVVDGSILDLKMASSGELGIVTGFLGLASVIEDGSLIFIDEPEISLHPEWQTKYIELLLQTFEHFKGCHFILATHSPLILSDIDAENSTVVSIDPAMSEPQPTGDVAGQSADFLLATVFHAPGRNNLYVKQEIIRALRLAANGEVNGKEFNEVIGELVKVLPSVGHDSPVAKVIRQLRLARSAAVKIDD